MKHSQLVKLLSKQPRQTNSDYQAAAQITQLSTPRGGIQSQQTLKLPNRLATLSTAMSKEHRVITEGNEEAAFDKIKDLENKLKSRCTTLEFLIQAIGKNQNQINSLPTIQKIEQLLVTIVNTMQSATKTEIELGLLNRERKICQSVNKIILKKEGSMYDRNKSLQQEVEMNMFKSNKLVEENQRLSKELMKEKLQNEANTKKISVLEKRMEFLVSNDINLFEMRSSLTGLLKENEQLKKDLERKHQEVERICGKLNQYQLVVSRLQKTIDNLRKKNDDEEMRGLIKKDDIELLMNYNIPQNLDFRIVCQKLYRQNLLNDICEKGVAITLQQMSTQSQEVQKQQILYISNQLLSYKDFSERINQVLLSVQEFNKCSIIEELILTVNRLLPQVFNCEIAKLWVLETKTGLLYSYLETRQELKALQDKGSISDTFKQYKAQNISLQPKKPILFRIHETEQQPEYAQNALLLPIFCVGVNVIRGVIVLSNSENEEFGLDEEYFGIIVSSFLSIAFQRLIDQQSWLIGQKYRSLMNLQLTQILRSENKQTAWERICISFQQLFGFSMVLFYFVENEEIVDYSKGIESRYSFQYGLAGMAVRNKQSYIVNDVKKSINFNPKVDLTSILPIFIQPLLNKQDQVIGVTETCLKNKLSIEIEREQLLEPNSGLFGIEEPLTTQLQTYVGLLAATLSNIKF